MGGVGRLVVVLREPAEVLVFDPGHPALLLLRVVSAAPFPPALSLLLLLWDGISDRVLVGHG